MAATTTHRFAVRTGTVALVLLLVSGLPASADVLVLRSGDRLTGTIVERDAVALDVEGQSSIAISPTHGGPPLEFSIEEIATVGLEYQGGIREVDLFVREPMPSTSRSLVRDFRESPGSIKLIIGGMAVGTVGLFVKFGERETDEFGEPVMGADRTDNQVNDALKLVGATMVVMGMALSIEEASSQSQGADGGDADIGLGCSPISGDPGVEVCFRF